VRRAKRRDWTLGALDREQGFYLWWNVEESRWSVEAARVFVMADGEAVLQLEQSGSPEPTIPDPAT
jgi:hypothetical protein